MEAEAQRLAALGYPVFPCSGKAPRRGCMWQQAATTDPLQLLQLLQGAVENLGIAVPRGTIVIDLDMKPAVKAQAATAEAPAVKARPAVDGVAALAGVMPKGWKHGGPKARTGGGGLHLWFRVSPLLQLGNSSGDLPPGIDVRSGGVGYVVVPPSIHPGTRRPYTWVAPMVPPAELPELPGWLTRRLLTPKAAPAQTSPGAGASLASTFPGSEPVRSGYLEGALNSAVDRVLGAGKGERNTVLNQEAYDLAGLAARGLSLHKAEERLFTAGTQAGLTERETRATIRSAFGAGSQRSRDVPEGAHRGAGQRLEAPPPRSDSESPGGGRELPVIRITPNEESVNNAAAIALASRDYHDLYQRSGELVRIVRHVILAQPGTSDTVKKRLRMSAGEPLIKPLALATLRERLAGSAWWEKYDKRQDDWIQAHPPEWAFRAVHARGTWEGIPPLYGIADFPIFRPDGSILTTSGYDPMTGYYLSTDFPEIQIPDKPTADDALHAVNHLLGLVKDFPFVGDVDRASWLALLLTLIARPMIDGPTPLFVIEATVAGTGKTLIADLVGLILNGRSLPAQTYSPSEEEIEKILVSVARLGLPVFNFDNVKLTIGGATVDKWLTSTTPTGRTLGSSEIRRYDWRTVMVATSNNAAIGGDTDRRTIYIRLQTDRESPAERDDFALQNIRAHVLEHRAEYLGSALMILKAFAAAGRPDQGGRNKGSFEAWAAAVRDPLLWTELPDCERPHDDPARPVDRDREALGPLLAALRDCFSDSLVSVSEIIDEAWPPRTERYSDEFGPSVQSKGLKSAIAALAYKGDKPTLQAVGRKLQRYRNRWLNNMCLVSKRDNKVKSNRWRVITRDGDASGGECGESAGSPGVLTRELAEVQNYTTDTYIEGAGQLPANSPTPRQDDLEF